MKKRMFLLIFVTALLLCACKVFDQKKMDLYLTAAYSFPGPTEDQGVTFGTHNISNIITDQYGRKMFTFDVPTTMNFYAMNCGLKNIGLKPDKALVIMQKSDAERIYFYEDVCFLLKTEKGFPKESIEKFQERNDWNQPLHPEKMSSRLLGAVFEGMENIKGDLHAIENLFHGKEIQRFIPLIQDYNGNVVYGVNTYDKQSDRFISYFIICDQEKHIDKTNGILELTTLDFGEELHELKIRNGWNFTDCPGADG